jgi:hypothetical protein
MAEAGARVTWEAAGEGERRWFVGTLATITVPGEASDGRRFALIVRAHGQENLGPALAPGD